MAYSTLSALPTDANIVTATTISATNENTHRSTREDRLNVLLVEAKAQEKNRASSTEPTDKLEGQIWADTTADPASLKYYKDGAGNLETLAGLTLAQTMTNKTLGSPVLTGVTLNAVGSAAAPSYAFTGDADTGIYRSSSNIIGFAGGGVEVGKISTAGFDLSVPAAGIKTDTGGTNEFWRIKIIEISDWNMDGTVSVTVTHGLTLAKIRKVSALIRDDADINYQDINRGESSSDGTQAGFVSTITATTVQLLRVTGGFFDSPNHNSTAFNRGWVYITYAE